MRLGDFALGGVATTLTLRADGRVARVRIACFGVGDRPIRVPDAEQSLDGATPGEAAFAEAGRIVSDRLEGFDDIHASARAWSASSTTSVSGASRTAPARATGCCPAPTN